MQYYKNLTTQVEKYHSCPTILKGKKLYELYLNEKQNFVILKFKFSKINIKLFQIVQFSISKSQIPDIYGVVWFFWF